MNKNTFAKDFNRHEAIKNNLARIKKRNVPTYAGRQGALPPLEGERRQGSAPTSTDARVPHPNDPSDYHTVAYGHQPASITGGRKVSNKFESGSKSVKTNKSSRSQAPINVVSPEPAGSVKRVEPMELISEADQDTSPKVGGKGGS